MRFLAWTTNVSEDVRNCKLLNSITRLKVPPAQRCIWRKGFPPGDTMTAIRMVSSLLLLVLMQSGALCARRFRGGRNPQPRRAPPPPTYRADRGDTTESFPLDFTAVEENMDNFMTQVKNLAQSLYPCSAQKLDYDMKLNFLENTSVTCNDGSSAGYVPLENTRRIELFRRLQKVLP